MAGLTTFHREVKERLDAVLPAFWGPAEVLPTVGGKVRQCAVLWPSTGVEATRADSTAVYQRRDTLRVVCVGQTVLDALAAAQKTRQALHGVRLTASGRGGGRIREAGFTGDPVPEPGTDPVRVSLTLQFEAHTKEPR